MSTLPAEPRLDAEFVVYRLEEAGRTLIALPGKGCLPAGFGSGWPQVVHAAVEAYGYDAEGIRPPVPSAQAITRMDEAFQWITLIPDDKRSHRRIVLMRAMVHPVTGRHRWSWRRIGNVFGWSHEAVRAWHRQGIDMLVRGLAEQPHMVSSEPTRIRAWEVERALAKQA